jgi:hypothetical protein
MRILTELVIPLSISALLLLLCWAVGCFDADEAVGDYTYISPEIQGSLDPNNTFGDVWPLRDAIRKNQADIRAIKELLRKERASSAQPNMPLLDGKTQGLMLNSIECGVRQMLDQGYKIDPEAAAQGYIAFYMDN